MPAVVSELTADEHRRLGAGLYNRTWELIEIETRRADQDDELVHTAHASAWHWRQVGTAANRARSEYLCARVYSVLGRPESALAHARRCVAIVEAGGDGFEDWDEAGACEAMARALLVAGDAEAARGWKARAMTALERVANANDREPIGADLAELEV
jgi:hypothetical protein